MSVSKDQTQQKKQPLFYVTLALETQGESPKGETIKQYKTLAFATVNASDKTAINELGMFALPNISKREMFEHFQGKIARGEYVLNIIAVDNDEAKEKLAEILDV